MSMGGLFLLQKDLMIYADLSLAFNEIDGMLLVFLGDMLTEMM